MGLPAGTKKAEHFCPAVSTEGCFSLAVEQRFAAQRHLQWLGRALLPKGETGAFQSAAAGYFGALAGGGKEVTRLAGNLNISAALPGAQTFYIGCVATALLFMTDGAKRATQAPFCFVLVEYAELCCGSHPGAMKVASVAQ